MPINHGILSLHKQLVLLNFLEIGMNYEIALEKFEDYILLAVAGEHFDLAACIV